MRVPRTFVFLDLSGFTNYTAAFGDDAAGRLLGAFRTIVREVASDRGVRIAKWLGDGCMIVAVDQADAIAFVARPREPLGRGVLAADAAGRHRHRLRPAVRGRRLHRLGRQHGRPPVRHRRRLRGADPDDGPRAPARGRRRRLPHDAVELAGFPGAIEVFELTGVPTAPDRNDTGELWTRSPFI